MEALLVVDVQNEFSAKGQRAVPNYEDAVMRIKARVAQSRDAKRPIAWVKHHNKPTESKAFVPGSWGAELSAELGASDGFGPEKLFEKDVYGAFTFTTLEEWLRTLGVTSVLIVGFYTHMCVSTTAREALVRGFEVAIDPDATGARALDHPLLGSQSADEVGHAALLHLTNMGVVLSVGS